MRLLFVAAFENRALGFSPFRKRLNSKKCCREAFIYLHLQAWNSPWSCRLVKYNLAHFFPIIITTFTSPSPPPAQSPPTISNSSWWFKWPRLSSSSPQNLLDIENSARPFWWDLLSYNGVAIKLHRLPKMNSISKQEDCHLPIQRYCRVTRRIIFRRLLPEDCRVTCESLDSRDFF